MSVISVLIEGVNGDTYCSDDIYEILITNSVKSLERKICLVDCRTSTLGVGH